MTFNKRDHKLILNIIEMKQTENRQYSIDKNTYEEFSPPDIKAFYKSIVFKTIKY